MLPFLSIIFIILFFYKGKKLIPTIIKNFPANFFFFLSLLFLSVGILVSRCFFPNIFNMIGECEAFGFYFGLMFGYGLFIFFISLAFIYIKLFKNATIKILFIVLGYSIAIIMIFYLLVIIFTGSWFKSLLFMVS